MIGRSEEGLGRLGGDPEISRRHARFQRLADGRLMVEDLGSTNGTLVGGAAIPAPTLLAAGDEVTVGTTTLRVVGEDPAAPVPAEPARRIGLRVVAGASPGAQIALGLRGGTVVGSEAAGASELAGDSTVAAKHAQLTPVDGTRFVLEDLGSQSGTWVDENRIAAPTVVRAGDSFRLGGTVLELSQVAASAAPRRDAALGGVRQVPTGLFSMIGARAPVTREQVLGVVAVSLGWGLGLDLLIRTLARESWNIPDDLNALTLSRVLLATIAPVVGNSIGFYSSFRRPTDRSAKRYLIPTMLIPVVFVTLALIRTNHHDAGSIVVTIAVTILPITLNAVLMLRLRARVSAAAVMSARGLPPPVI